MSVPLTINGVTFQYPQEFDTHWGPTLTNWSTAVTNALQPITGGFLTLPYPTSGILYQNVTHTGYLSLTINASNQLTFNGIPIGATTTLTNGHIFVGNVTNNPADVSMSGDITISNLGVTTLGSQKVFDVNINNAAAITLSKLASTSPYFWYAANSSGVLSPLGITASRAIISDSNGLPSVSSVTSTELGYVSGVTSPIQTQLNNITSGFLPLSGGTMSGSINMASHKITNVMPPTATGDALSWGQTFTSGSITFSPTTSGIVGTTTNDDAATGIVGEYISASVTTLTNLPATNLYGSLTSISLTAGDWDVTGLLTFYFASSNATQYNGGIDTSATSPTFTAGDGRAIISGTSGNSGYVTAFCMARYSLSSTTTIYLDVLGVYTAGNPQAAGTIRARRVR